MQDIASGALFVPFGHVEQEEDRFSDAYFPDSHDVHTVAPFGEIEYVPARHGMQDCPSDALFVPFGHVEHVVDRLSDANFPDSHDVHTVAPFGEIEYVPA